MRQDSRKAAWLAPLMSYMPLLVLFGALTSMFKKGRAQSLGDVFEFSIGKPAGKALLVFYLLWCVILYLLYIRYYAERLLSTIFPNTDIRFFIFVMMPLVFMAARGRFEVFTRFAELFFLVFTVIMSAFFLLLLPSVKLENLYPVTLYDLFPAAKAAYPVLAIWGYALLLLFFGEKVADKDKLSGHGKKAALFLVIMNTLIIVTVVGTIGTKVVQKMPIPFFSAIKAITVMETLNRFESVLLSMWVVSDFIVITVFALIIMRILERLFDAADVRQLSSPVALLGYSGSQYFTENRAELSAFSGKIGLAGNLIFCFLIPLAVFVIGKLRKKI
jgi:spore germination protein (amino acid permease)